MRVIDTKGQKCPAPLIAAKQTLTRSKAGETFEVQTDSRSAAENISRFLKDNGVNFSVEEKNGIWAIQITKSQAQC